ncbi:MAG: segregation and condensation protein A [Gammaproteobacteria bacterium]|nr:segregation and condensation protein A [Gammaproteobacteria bacterium]
MSEDKQEDEKAMEKRIMVMMRQVLSAVARETVPPPGMKHTLSDNTIQGIRECLALISAREQELNIDLGETNQERPRYVDEPQTSKVVSLDSIIKN